MKRSVHVAVVAVLLMTTAVARGAPEAANDEKPLDDKTPLKAGDLVKVQIVEEKREGLQHKVREDGMLRVPVLGDQKAAGLTAKTLAENLKTKLEKKFFKTATVWVERVTDPKAEETPTFTVLGGVARQGVYDLYPGEELTVPQALLRAGGPMWHFRDVIIIRKSPEGETRIKTKVHQVFKRGDLSKDIRIQPGDVITLPSPVFNF